MTCRCPASGYFGRGAGARPPGGRGGGGGQPRLSDQRVFISQAAEKAPGSPRRALGGHLRMGARRPPCGSRGPRSGCASRRALCAGLRAGWRVCRSGTHAAPRGPRPHPLQGANFCDAWCLPARRAQCAPAPRFLSLLSDVLRTPGCGRAWAAPGADGR